MPKVIIPTANFRLICPKCGGKTRYRRKGYDGELGEGQFCDKCNQFIGAMINRSFPEFVSVEEDKISELHTAIQVNVNKYFKRVGDAKGNK